MKVGLPLLLRLGYYLNEGWDTICFVLNITKEDQTKQVCAGMYPGCKKLLYVQSSMFYTVPLPSLNTGMCRHIPLLYKKLLYCTVQYVLPLPSLNTGI